MLKSRLFCAQSYPPCRAYVYSMYVYSMRDTKNTENMTSQAQTSTELVINNSHNGIMEHNNSDEKASFDNEKDARIWVKHIIQCQERYGWDFDGQYFEIVERATLIDEMETVVIGRKIHA